MKEFIIFIVENANNITFAVLFVLLFAWQLFTSKEREEKSEARSLEREKESLVRSDKREEKLNEQIEMQNTVLSSTLKDISSTLEHIKNK